MREVEIEAVAASATQIAGAEPILEDLGLAAMALEALCERAACDAEQFELDGAGGWAAAVRVDGTDLLVASRDGDRWSISAPPGTDESDAAFAARTLHGLLGGKGEESDLDR